VCVWVRVRERERVRETGQIRREKARREKGVCEREEGGCECGREKGKRVCGWGGRLEKGWGVCGRDKEGCVWERRDEI